MNELYGNEQLLLNEVAAGARKAFNELYTAYIGEVYEYIYLFTKSREETEEILQEVFLSIWENREKLAEITPFKPYLFRAAKNKLINHIRHTRIKKRVFSDIRSQHRNIHRAADYELMYKEYHHLIQEAVAKLPPKRKMIFKMNIEEGALYDEIAKDLNISKSVVKKQFYKACHSVRQYLYEKGEIVSFSLTCGLLLFF